MTMTPLLFLLAFSIGCVLVYFIVDWMELPQRMDRITKVVLGLIALYILLLRFDVLKQP